jgi:hypothetical protein
LERNNAFQVRGPDATAQPQWPCTVSHANGMRETSAVGTVDAADLLVLLLCRVPVAVESLQKGVLHLTLSLSL